MIELFGGSSPNAHKVLIMLEELGLAYTQHSVKVLYGEQYAPEFLKMNPIGKYPVIIDRAGPDPEQAIFESGAILLYLAETYGGDFITASGPARWETMKWLFAQVAWVGPMFGQHVHFRIQPSEAGGYAATRYGNQARKVCEVLDGRLAQSAYLAGEAYGLADIATHSWVGYLPKLGFDWADYPALKAWYDRISARPAVIRATVAMSDLAKDRAPPRSEDDYNLFFGRTSGPKIDYSAIGVAMKPLPS